MWSPILENWILATPHHRQQRIKTQGSYEKCRTIQTEESGVYPCLQHYLHSEPETEEKSKYVNYEEERGEQPLSRQLWKVDHSEISTLFKQMHLFSKDQRSFIKKKIEVITKLKIDIQQKESMIKNNKRRYDRQSETMKERKSRMEKFKKIVKQMELKRQYMWAVRIKKLKEKYERKKNDNDSFVQSSFDVQRRRSDRSTRQKFQLKLPLLMPMHSQCYTCRYSNQDPTRHAYTQDNYSQVNGYEEEEPKFIKTGKKMSEDRLRTEPTDGFYTRRQSKAERPSTRYMQDYESSEDIELKTERNHVKKKDSVVYKLVSTLDLNKRRPTEPKNSQKIEEYLKETVQKGDSSAGVHKIDSDTMVVSEVPLSDDGRRWTLGQEEEEDMPALLEQSTRRQQFTCNLMKVNDGIIKQKNNHKTPSTDYPDIPKMQKSSSVSSNEDSIKRSPIKLSRMMAESSVRIEVSDEEPSRISKNSKIYQNTPNSYKNPYEENFTQIVEESDQFTSLQTTPNNAITPPLTPPNEGAEHSKISMKSSSLSNKPNSGIPRPQGEQPELMVPVKKPPLLEFSELNNEGISKIQLNMMSRQSRNLPMAKKQELQPQPPSRKYSDDDNLMGITLVGSSKISRQRASDLKETQQLKTKLGQLQNGNVKKSGLSDDDFDFDVDLCAESTIVKKKPKLNQSSSPAKIDHPILKDIEAIEQQNQDQPSTHLFLQ